jgi:hypothetical protein
MSELIRNLEKAKKEGLKNGASGNPPPQAQHPDAIEINYSITAQKLFGQEKERFNKSQIEIEKKVKELKGSVEEFENELSTLEKLTNIEEIIEAKLDENVNKHQKVVKDYLLKDASLKRYKIENNIHRVAVYPQDYHSHFSWIFLILTQEAIVNGFFFSANVGYAIGAIIALVFSFINVSIGVVAGIFFRYKNSQDQAEKFFGWAVLVIASVALIYINSVLSTYRSLTEISKSENVDIIANLFTKAIAEGYRIFALEIPFAEMNGFLLFFAGMISAGIAVWKGYTALDALPGYTEVDKQAKSAEKIKHQIEKECADLANTATKKEREKREKGLRNLQFVKSTSTKLKADFDQKCNQISNKMAEIRSDHKQIIVAYRDSVRAVTPLQVPNYFHDEPFLQIELNDDSILNTKNEIEELVLLTNRLHEDHSKRLHDQIAAIDNSNNTTATLVKDFFVRSEEKAKADLGAGINVINVRS